ncbi:unnamed protein product [Polarella glacialis]|uniref:Uncharacterized protein n=1 Tax=Polarella glacialis TaxID=89957 RepID=A0A813K4X4_POLGL|nr:unnamed protein product [Polarella glacialis]
MRNPVCRKCNCPKPDGPAGAAAIAGAPGASMSYVAQATVGESSWSRQWSAGPVNGMFVGETELPAWLTGEDQDEVPKKKRKKASKGSSSSSSTSPDTKKKAKAKDGEAGQKAKATSAEAKKTDKVKKYPGLTKEEKKKKKAEDEEEKRRQMRERRKARTPIIELE